jgi:adenylate cyclase
MPDLIAQGTEAQHRWRRSLPEGEAIVLGRAAGLWSVPWDQHVSRQHVRLQYGGSELRVMQLAVAVNPVFFRGKECPRFGVRPGEHFVIGETTFTLANQRASVTFDAPQPTQQHSFSTQYLRQIQFRNPDHRIEVLTRLPEALSGTTDDQELFVRLVSMILAGAPRADAAAVVAIEGQIDPQNPLPLPVRVLHWDQRLVISRDFQPSHGLILEALRQGQSVLHVWRGLGQEGVARFTEREDVDWAFATPIGGKSCRGWALYVAGRFSVEPPGLAGTSDPSDLREDVKFTELVAATLSSLRGMRILERQHATLSQFFSPVVLETLAVEDPDLVLTPRETVVSVLFCDLRGFSRRSERHADDLMGLLERVSRALGVMTAHIRQQGGVVGDFHGDAAMGFWGWPLVRGDTMLRTCRAALAISAEFQRTAQDPDSPLADFRVGIGLATGKAVAGKIGTVDLVKVTVFGPVVNLASRLEGMTKVFRAPILLDGAMARSVRGQVSPEVARVRRIAIVKPYGLDTPLEVSELLPPAAQYPELTDEHLQTYETALEHFLAGRWPKAFEMLHRIPAEDRVKDFLTVFIAEHNRTPPPGWNGVIPLVSK